MTAYEVNEIFQSVKGEGLYTGVPMNFIRLAGCNLRCTFCDTEWATHEDIDIAEILSRLDEGISKVVLTGGEPTIHDLEPLIFTLRRAGYSIHLETNGTNPIPSGVSWMALSPKSLDVNESAVLNADEIKFLWRDEDYSKSFIIDFMEKYKLFGKSAKHLYIMPLAKGIDEGAQRNASDLNMDNAQSAIDFIMTFPYFKLCTQVHKVWGIL